MGLPFFVARSINFHTGLDTAQCTVGGEHRSPVEETSHGKNKVRQQKNSPTVPYNSEFVQIMSMGERCSPLQIIRESLSYRKIATLGGGFCFVLGLCFGQLCPFLTPHSSFLSPLCCFFSNFVLYYIYI